MRVVVRESPRSDKKFRASVYDRGKVDVVDFGGAGYSDYTLHGDAFRMRRYVVRHGGKVPVRLLSSTSKEEVDKKMLRVMYSDTESWGIRGIRSAGFWSRWLLWSFPDKRDAARFIEKKFGVVVDLKLKRRKVS
jgi:hypothetical protein